MQYISTRNSELKATPSEAIINGLADDGGLYIPNIVPKINELKELVSLDYKQLSLKILQMYFTDFTYEELKECVYKAYDDKFRSHEVVSLKKCSDMYFLELFHGQTLAFKDIALSVLPYLMKLSAKKNDLHDEIVILTATSGDTGKAALEGFKNVEGIKIIVFFPKNGVSEVQKMQMLSQEGENTNVVMIDGNFDDAQNGVKQMFTDKKFKEKLVEQGVVLSSANSINIGRLVPQIVYYIYSYMKLVRDKEISIGDSINIGVPTGNFGNILAGYYAKKMGLPIDKLICASNENKVLTDFIGTGIYDTKREFIVTSSPSMDILVSSNLERLLYETTKDSKLVSRYMKSLKDNNEYKIEDNHKNKLIDFYGDFASEVEVTKAIDKVYRDHKYVMDTHTAVAYHVCAKYQEQSGDNKKIIIASTASPFKFAGSVYRALKKEEVAEYNEFELINKLSKEYNLKVPYPIRDLEKKDILHNLTCTNKTMKSAVLKTIKGQM
ncbi:threonine synthase [Clostridiaceae bacterium M8S5]|nr:threonine synthase [Clostridiaceae bacterium M8S5]